MSLKKSLTIIGGGAWGSTLAELAKRNGHSIKVWTRSSSVSLAPHLLECDILISAVAMSGVRDTIALLQHLAIPKELLIVSATKGLDFATGHTPCQIWQEAFPHHPMIVLSGPNLSKEIMQGLPAATVVASIHTKAAVIVQEVFASETFRVYLNDDPLGTELGGTLKNVMAIAAGVCDGLQLGTNAKSGLVTRALPEMIRVGSLLGAKATTFFGLSGLGDLIATCSSPLSRNYQVGYQLAQGQSISNILAHLQGTAEGVNTARVLVKLAQENNLVLPITYQVYQLLQGETTPPEALKSLMERELKGEFSDISFNQGV